LKPQIDFGRGTRRGGWSRRKTRSIASPCAEPFGTRGAIERVVEKLGEKHWMFAGPDGPRRGCACS
jgi:hypothetical protein